MDIRQNSGSHRWLAESAEQTFNVTSSTNHGFVRVSPTDSHYFAFDDGSFYFPIGLNMGWSTGSVLEDYTRWLDHLSQSGGKVQEQEYGSAISSEEHNAGPQV